MPVHRRVAAVGPGRPDISNVPRGRRPRARRDRTPTRSGRGPGPARRRRAGWSPRTACSRPPDPARSAGSVTPSREPSASVSSRNVPLGLGIDDQRRVEAQRDDARTVEGSVPLAAWNFDLAFGQAQEPAGQPVAVGQPEDFRGPRLVRTRSMQGVERVRRRRTRSGRGRAGFPAGSARLPRAYGWTSSVVSVAAPIDRAVQPVAVREQDERVPRGVSTDVEPSRVSFTRLLRGIDPLGPLGRHERDLARGRTGESGRRPSCRRSAAR